jgi:hypothetical protein
MKFAGANKSNRKSGVAEWGDLRFPFNRLRTPLPGVFLRMGILFPRLWLRRMF